MATWKKVIVSGSTANLSALQVDNLISGQVVIGGGTSNLSTTAINGSGNIVATTGATGLSHSGSFTGSFFGVFEGTTNLPDLTQGTGITTFTYDGNTTATVEVSGASTLNTNIISKWTGNAFANSSLTDNGTTITGNTSLQLTGANSNISGSFSGSFAGDGANVTGVVSSSYAASTNNITNAITNNTNNNILTATGTGIINGEGNLTFDGTTLTVSGNSIITGDLTVSGTTTFINTTNLSVKDQVILVASGSTSLVDSGWVSQYNAAGSGSAFYLEATSTNTYGRFAVAYDVLGTSTSITPDEFVVTAKTTAGNPSAAPTWGGATSGYGNIHIHSGTGDIFIYS